MTCADHNGVIGRALEAGRRRMTSFHGDCRVVRIPAVAGERAERAATNVNTPQEWREIQR